MTEKRFTLVDIGFVYDNNTLIGMKEIVELLNMLHEENEQLNKENERLCNFNLHKLLDKKNKEIEQLKKQLNYSKAFVLNNNGKVVSCAYLKSLEKVIE